MIGSPAREPGRFVDEHQHGVLLTRGYWLQTTPVTQLQWECTTGLQPSHFAGCADAPVESVTWFECDDFIRSLRARYPGLRMPTEAEWEFACRAGTETAYNSGVSIGEEWAHYETDSTALTGARRPNAWGLFDMHGNVWEWCSDRYGKYPRRKVVDPVGPPMGACRVVRGGSWFDRASRIRSAVR
ncbi:MAG: formylglycine-generating enzyme family protein, partial [Candidatus Omnitrophica bacterium]|nr:formylglycine-generating enzyme family protein [Candidatus Omnitrophota bacterium]